MYNSNRLANPTAFIKSMRPLLYQVVTLADATVEIDYTSAGFTKIPIVIFTAKILLNDAAVNIDIVNAATLTKVKLRARRMNSLAGLGVLPTYGGVAGVNFDVTITPRP